MKNTLAVKALNQYRKRDIIPYLGLRYYLQSAAGSEDRWIKDVSTRLAITAQYESYLRTYHFKGGDGAQYEHRDIYLPSPNEILAETALITEISKHEAFKPKAYVYSYRYSAETDKSGVFQPYFNGFKERHFHIAAACKVHRDKFVIFTDIKRFYPSIRSVDAYNIWEFACGKSNIGRNYKELGFKILERHAEVCSRDGSGNGLLTGPMFSHVIANLLLDEIDSYMHLLTNGNYWRYVDDVILIGGNEEVIHWRSSLDAKFKELGLVLHDGDKDFKVSCEQWLEGENDFNQSIDKTWVNLISDVKRFLLANPLKVSELQSAFANNHIRIPVIDYSNAVKDESYLQRFLEWKRKFRWAAKSVHKITIDSLVNKAKICEIELHSQLKKLLKERENLSLYNKKRQVHKLRYFSGRLLYLLKKDDLSLLSEELEKYPELYLIARAMDAIATKNMTDIVCMGSNATHIVAQLIRVDSKQVAIDDHLKLSPLIEQSLAVIEFNGITHNLKNLESELILLAKAEKMDDLMKSTNHFIKEFACLHGMEPVRHEEVLDSSFDKDEELALDILSQLQSSSHC